MVVDLRRSSRHLTSTKASNINKSKSLALENRRMSHKELAQAISHIFKYVHDVMTIILARNAKNVIDQTPYSLGPVSLFLIPQIKITT